MTGLALSGAAVGNAKDRIQPLLMERILFEAAVRLSRPELARQVDEIVDELLPEEPICLNGRERAELVELMLEDMPMVRDNRLAGGFNGEDPEPGQSGGVPNKLLFSLGKRSTP